MVERAKHPEDLLAAEASTHGPHVGLVPINNVDVYALGTQLAKENIQPMPWPPPQHHPRPHECVCVCNQIK